MSRLRHLSFLRSAVFCIFPLGAVGFFAYADTTPQAQAPKTIEPPDAKTAFTVVLCDPESPVETLFKIPKNFVDLGNTPSDVVTYALPKTSLQVTVTYTLYKELTYTNGYPTRKTLSRIAVEKPIAIASLTEPDGLHTYRVVANKSLRNIWHDYSFSVTVGSSGILAAFDQDVADQTIPAAMNFIELPFRIAGLASTGGLVPK